MCQGQRWQQTTGCQPSRQHHQSLLHRYAQSQQQFACLSYSTLSWLSTPQLEPCFLVLLITLRTQPARPLHWYFYGWNSANIRLCWQKHQDLGPGLWRLPPKCLRSWRQVRSSYWHTTRWPPDGYQTDTSLFVVLWECASCRRLTYSSPVARTARWSSGTPIHLTWLPLWSLHTMARCGRWYPVRLVWLSPHHHTIRASGSGRNVMKCWY